MCMRTIGQFLWKWDRQKMKRAAVQGNDAACVLSIAEGQAKLTTPGAAVQSTPVFRIPLLL